MQVLTISITTLIGLAVADKQFIFKCPNKPSANSIQPSNDINGDVDGKAGFLSGVNTDASSNVVYAQIQAARALVPCDENAVSVFTPINLRRNSSNPHDLHSVAVIYTDKASTHNIKAWLK